MRLCVSCLLLEAAYTERKRETERERAFEEGNEKEEDTGGGGEEEEKTKMREMEGLGRRRDRPVAWLALKRRGLDHPYQMHGLRSQDHEGMERSRSNSQAAASPRVPEACRWLTFDDRVTSQAPRFRGPLHPAPRLWLLVSTSTLPGLEPRPLHSHRQSGR